MAEEIGVTDEEIEAMMAELEIESAKIVGDQKAAVKAAAPEIKVEVEQRTPDPVVEPVAATVPAAKPEPVPAVVVAPEDVPEAGGDPELVPTATSAKTTNALQHYVNVDQFKADTRVTDATLDTCMIEQNGLRAFYGAEAARAEAQAARLKARFEVVEATLYDEHRKKMALAGEKTTEKMVENAVKIDPRWLRAKNTVIESETIASINKALVESLKDRRDMIIQLGADRRDEYKGQARVMMEREASQSLRDRALASAQTRAA